MAEEPRGVVEMLDRPTCLGLLATKHTGRLVTVVQGQPEIAVVNFVCQGDSVVFALGPDSRVGSSIGGPVAFEVDDIDEAHTTGWSVVLHGYGREVTGDARMASSWGPAPDPHPWAPRDLSRLVQVVPRTITGRRVTRRAAGVEATTASDDRVL